MARRKPSSGTTAVTKHLQVDDPEPDWTADELAEPHDCPGCGIVCLFAEDFCDDDCRRRYLAGQGFMSLEEGPDARRVYAGMAKPRAQSNGGPRAGEPLEPEELIGLEGEARKHMVVHRTRERGLRVAKIQRALRANNGRLRCEVPGCGFDFAQTYGELGRTYAHVHHVKPLGGRARKSPTDLSGLAIVCANCHAMIHRWGESRGIKTLIPR